MDGGSIFDGDGSSVHLAEGSVFVLRVHGVLTRADIEAALRTIWALPSWSQPWGLVVSFDAEGTYEPEIRLLSVPPVHRRAVATAVAAPRFMYRMVVHSIGVGLRLTSAFELTAHEREDEAIDHIAARVRHAHQANRRY